MTLGEVFADQEVARLYRHRPPYSQAVFEILGGLIREPRVVLDAGAGTGAVARGLVEMADRIDAVEPSAAMIAEGRDLPGGNDPRIRWIQQRIEDAEIAGRYGLITCGASLHWMDLDRILPRFRDLLAPDASVAIADNDYEYGEYREEVLAIIREHSELKEHAGTTKLMEQLIGSGRLAIEGQEHTEAAPFEQSVGDFIEMLHSTSTLARVRLGERAERFDEQVRSVFARHGLATVRYGVVGYVAWGRPS